jgi:hypothetical protein
MFPETTATLPSTYSILALQQTMLQNSQNASGMGMPNSIGNDPASRGFKPDPHRPGAEHPSRSTATHFNDLRASDPARV